MRKRDSIWPLKKGYKAGKEGYIVFEKNDLDKIKLKTTKSIDIREFVDATELDPILIEDSLLCRSCL